MNTNYPLMRQPYHHGFCQNTLAHIPHLLRTFACGLLHSHPIMEHPDTRQRASSPRENSLPSRIPKRARSPLPWKSRDSRSSLGVDPPACLEESPMATTELSTIQLASATTENAVQSPPLAAAATAASPLSPFSFEFRHRDGDDDDDSNLLVITPPPLNVSPSMRRTTTQHHKMGSILARPRKRTCLDLSVTPIARRMTGQECEISDEWAVKQVDNTFVIWLNDIFYPNSVKEQGALSFIASHQRNKDAIERPGFFQVPSLRKFEKSSLWRLAGMVWRHDPISTRTLIFTSERVSLLFC
jgi:hypothetical protein